MGSEVDSDNELGSMGLEAGEMSAPMASVNGEVLVDQAREELAVSSVKLRIPIRALTRSLAVIDGGDGEGSRNCACGTCEGLGSRWDGPI